MDLECPYCKENNDVDCEDLPSNACDDSLYECIHCKREIKIGWHAEVEVRQVFNIAHRE